MCVGIPGLVVEMVDNEQHLALVDVAGVRRHVDVSLVLPDGLQVGDWVLLHVGFAMSILDEAEAHRTLELIELMSELFDDELQALNVDTSS